MNKESFIKEKVNYSAVGEQISNELAAKMIKNHQDLHSEDGSNTYLIGKDIIEKILAQPGCAGICLIDAINESGKKTLVYVGIDDKGKNILKNTSVNEDGELAVTEGLTGDRTMPYQWG